MEKAWLPFEDLPHDGRSTFDVTDVVNGKVGGDDVAFFMSVEFEAFDGGGGHFEFFVDGRRGERERRGR